jgi:hypothetical protein
MAGLVPAIHVVQWRRGVLYCRRLLSAWAVYKPNHVDGRDKPGHDGKCHGKQDLTSLFLVSEAKQFSPPPPTCRLRRASRPETMITLPVLQTRRRAISWGHGLLRRARNDG